MDEGILFYRVLTHDSFNFFPMPTHRDFESAPDELTFGPDNDLMDELVRHGGVRFKTNTPHLVVLMKDSGGVKLSRTMPQEVIEDVARQTHNLDQDKTYELWVIRYNRPHEGDIGKIGFRIVTGRE